jgi:transcription initiation factor IIE alpha subunit
MNADPQIAREAFTGALCRAFEMEPDDAREIVDAVLERFSASEEVDDETLDADLRSVFYTLESKRMVSFRRVEYTREDGDRRRAFYWKLRMDSLLHEVPIQHEDDDVDVYANLPATAWSHTAHAG